MSVNVGFGHLSEVAVAVDVLLLVAVLQLVVLDVEPKSLHDVGPSLCVHAQQAGQPWVQFVLRGLGTEKKKEKKRRGHPVTFLLKDGGELYERRQDVDRARGWYLVIQHEQEGAFDVDVAGPFYLETIRLLSGGHSVPLKDQMKKYDKLKYVTYKVSKTRTGRYLFYLINRIMALLYFILSSKKASC